MRQECGVGTGRWTPGRRLQDVTTERAVDLIDLTFQVIQKSHPGHDMKNVYVDISQDGKHRPMGDGAHQIHYNLDGVVVFQAAESVDAAGASQDLGV